MNGMSIKQSPNSAPAGVPEEGYGLSLADVLRIIWERLAVVLLVAVLLTGTVVGFSLTQRPMYQASTKVVIGEDHGKNAVDEPLQGQVEGLQALASVMATAIDSRRVAEATIQQLDMRVSPNTFVKNLSAEQVSTSPFIEIKYKDPSPGRAQLVANTVAEVFPDQISEVNMGNTEPVTVDVWEPAVVPKDPVSPNPLRNGFVALMFGLVLGVGLAFLLEYMDDGWRSPEEVEEISGVPTYALIPRYDFSATKPPMTRAFLPARSMLSLFRSETPNGREDRD